MLPVSSGRRLLMLALAIVVAIGVSAPAFSQTTGILKGTVVDEKGQPVEKAKVTIQFAEGANRTYTVNTDKKGAFIQVGIQPGRYDVTAEKEKVGAQTIPVKVKLGDPTEVKFVISPKNAAVSKEDAKKAADVQRLFNEGVTATGAGDFDGAVAKFNEAIALYPQCFDCYYNIGQAHTQKKEYDKAEAAFKKALELKADYADAYNGLTTVYNAQKRFEEAQAASQKAAELSGAGAGAAAGGGGGNVNALYNQGVIAWNANKFEDAKTKFEEAIKIDGNHADSHFQLGMCLINLGKLPEAGAEFDTYLKLAPTGQYAAQAKAMQGAIPKK